MKQCRNESKQTVNFRVVDVTFFKKDGDGKLRQLPHNASKEDILTADSATLRLTNQKNGWKGVCINHHVNGDSYYCPVKALGRRIVHIREHSNDGDLGICAFFNGGCQFDVNDNDIRQALKFAVRGGRARLPRAGYPDRSRRYSLATKWGGERAVVGWVRR